MHNSKLIRLLQSLSKRELSRFGEFVQSPYFNKNTEFIAFYEFLLPFSPGFKSKKLQKERVAHHFDLNDTTEATTLAYWMNGLVQLFESFVRVEKLQDDSLKKYQYLIQFFHEREHFSASEKLLRNAEKGFKKQVLRNSDFLNNYYQLSKTAYETTNKNKRVFIQELQTVSHQLDQFYLVEKLRYCCEMINFENILNVHYDLQLGEVLIPLLEGHPLLEVPAISVYFNILKMLQSKDEDYAFQKVKTLIQQHEGVFTIREIKEFYTHVLNYCTRRINRFNDERYWMEYLEINKTLLAKGLLFEKNLLSPWRYTNLVNVGLKTGQTAWTKSFIETYKDKLPEEYKESMFAYNSGVMQYYLKDYDAAQRQIIHLETKDVLLNVLNRSLLVKIYYESDQIELLLFSLEANRIFLLRNKLIDQALKSQMKHFLDVTKKLAKIEGSEADKLLPLKNKLPDASGIMHRDWLVEQLDKKIKELL